MSKNFFLKSCTKCMLPETYETFDFDKNGVCNVCNNHKHQKSKIDWDARAKTFEKLVEGFRTQKKLKTKLSDYNYLKIALEDKLNQKYSAKYKAMLVFVFNKLNKLGIAPDRPDDSDGVDWYSKEMFDFYDDDGTMFKAFNKFMNFLEEEELPQSRDAEVARGVRTYRKIGPAVIIDSMLTVFNSRGQYDLDRALEDVIKSNIMPALEGLERNELKCLMLKAQEVLGQDHGITNTLEKMVDSPGLSVFG